MSENLTYYSELNPTDCDIVRCISDENGIIRVIFVTHPIFNGKEKKFIRYEPRKNKVIWRCKIQEGFGFEILVDISQQLAGKRR